MSAFGILEESVREEDAHDLPQLVDRMNFSRITSRTGPDDE